MSNEERNLLSVAYKNSVGTRRAAWRTISAIQDKEEHKGTKFLDLIKLYRQKIEDELNGKCEDVINLLKKNLIPNATAAPDAKVFYMKMLGDYYRYLCEFNANEK